MSALPAYLGCDYALFPKPVTRVEARVVTKRRDDVRKKLLRSLKLRNPLVFRQRASKIPDREMSLHSAACWDACVQSIRRLSRAASTPHVVSLDFRSPSTEVRAIVCGDRPAPTRLGNRSIDSLLAEGRKDSTEATAYTVGTQHAKCRLDEHTIDGKGMLFQEEKAIWRKWPKLWERKWKFRGQSADSRTAVEVEQWKSLFASGIEAPTFARPTARHHWGVAKLLLSELKLEFVGLATSLLLMVVSRGLSARVPDLLKRAVNTLHDEVKKNGMSESGASSTVKNILLQQCLTQVLQAVASELQVTLFAAVGEKARQGLMRKVFAHLHSLDFSFHAGRSPGAVGKILDRGGAALGLTTSAMVFEFLPNILELYFMERMLRRSLGKAIADISTGTIVAYATWSIPLIHWGSRFKQEVNRYDNIVGSKVSDSLHNHVVVKLYNGEQEELNKYQATQQALGDAVVRYRKSISLLNIGQKVILTTGVSCMLKNIMDDVAKGKLTMGDLVLLKAYVLQAKRPLEAMGLMYRKTRQGLTDISNLFQLFKDMTPSISNCKNPMLVPPGKGRIEIKSVGYEYPAQMHPGSKNKAALQSLNLVIHPKEILGVVGTSGSGKTTLTRLLTRLIDPSEGKVTLDGMDIKKVDLEDLRNHVIVVPQEPMLFSETVAYNIAYGRLDAGRSEIEAAAVKAQVDDAIRAKSEGYHSIVGNMGHQLSGGERQRVALARALLKTPRVLIYDEATSSLDATTEANVINAITSIKDRPTTVIVAHRLSTVRNADRIVVLSGGRISESGTHDQLIRNQGKYAEMWRQQQCET